MIWHITYNNIFIGYSYHDIYLSNEMYDHQAAHCEDPNCNITLKTQTLRVKVRRYVQVLV